MDHPDKLKKLSELNFLTLIEQYKMTNTTLDIDNVDDDDQKAEEEFFHIMAGCVSRLGIWCLELFGNVDKLLGPEFQGVFDQLFSRIVDKAIQLLDTNKPRIANQLLEFSHLYMTANGKVQTLDQNDPLFTKVKGLIEVLFKHF